MKKKVILIALVLVVVSLFLAIKLNGATKTIEEAINIPGSKAASIIYEEKNDKGSIVFSYISDGNGLYTAVVRKGIMGIKPYTAVCRGT